ncbi:MAG: amidase family protein, partial [Gemmatimonadales bacterium]|nr:amidase family protein [Gemmatimonadales bacterium]
VRALWGVAQLARLRSGRLARGVARGLAAGPRAALAALDRRDACIAGVDARLGDAAAWLLPVQARTAFPHAPTGAPVDVDGARVPYDVACAVHVALASLTGHPALSVPVGFGPDGLPVGVQLLGHRWDEPRLLAVARALEHGLGAHPPAPLPGLPGPD